MWLLWQRCLVAASRQKSAKKGPMNIAAAGCCFGWCRHEGAVSLLDRSSTPHSLPSFFIDALTCEAACRHVSKSALCGPYAATLWLTQQRDRILAACLSKALQYGQLQSWKMLEDARSSLHHLPSKKLPNVSRRCSSPNVLRKPTFENSMH